MNDLEHGRLRREWRTLDAMIALYCRRRHHGGRRQLCPACTELRVYARQRLAQCPFGADKPTCANCQVHCYKPAPREQVREVMRVAGPGMLLHHPVLALLHLWVDGRRPAPAKPPRRTRAGAGEPAAPPGH